MQDAMIIVVQVSRNEDNQRKARSHPFPCRGLKPMHKKATAKAGEYAHYEIGNPRSV
jgi:hypothetical protein